MSNLDTSFFESYLTYLHSCGDSLLGIGLVYLVRMPEPGLYAVKQFRTQWVRDRCVELSALYASGVTCWLMKLDGDRTSAEDPRLFFFWGGGGACS